MYSTTPRNSYYIVFTLRMYFSEKRDQSPSVLDTTTGDKYVIHVQYSTENCEFKSKVRPILHDSTPWFAFTENINVLYT